MAKDLEGVLQDIFDKQQLLYAVLSSPTDTKNLTRKISIRPILLKQDLHYQLTEYQVEKTFHRNTTPSECKQLIQNFLTTDFSQGLLCTAKTDYHVLISKKGHLTILQKPPTQSTPSLFHNRKKQYLLEEGIPAPFLIELGVMSPSGKILPKKNDKFKQLNRFLEMVEDILPHLEKERTLRIIDFGCGKAYLTFALYHYLVCLQGYRLDIHGLDLKEDVITHCQALARKLDYTGLQFSVGDIQHFSPGGKVDMVIALHACDTATDGAIAQALKWDSEVILCVPCCQKELFPQVRNSELTPILQHGILKERFASLATDAARSKLLEIAGYYTQVLEFIDLDHTPKNLLIRAVKRPGKQSMEKDMEEYRLFTKTLGITPYLEKYVLPSNANRNDT